MSSEVEQCIAQPKSELRLNWRTILTLLLYRVLVTYSKLLRLHFHTPLDKVLNLLDKEFRESISKYSDFSEFDNDKILFEVFGYITEKRYDSSTGYMFFNAFSSIFKSKVVITYANKMKEDTVIVSNFLENKISIFKCQEHFDLLRTPDPATASNISSE